jgi:N-methylhydantoinase B
MTNTLNTPIEALEMTYPLRIERYAVRHQSGGQGRYTGGNGIIRDYRFLEATQVTLLTERRASRPWGLGGGDAGLAGENRVDGMAIAAKVSLALQSGQVLSIATPGGGGWGRVDT